MVARIVVQHGEYGGSETMERALVKSGDMGATFMQDPEMGGARGRSEGQKLMAFVGRGVGSQATGTPRRGQKFIAQWQAKRRPG